MRPSITCFYGTILVFVLLSGCGDLTDGNELPKGLQALQGKLTSTISVSTNDEISIGILWAPGEAVEEAAATVSLDPVLDRRALELEHSGGDFHNECDGEFMLTQVIESRYGMDAPIQSYHLTYAAQFPIEFQIPLTEQPPETAVATGSDEFRLAMGLVFAYQDLDQSKAFETGTPETVRDRFLAMSQKSREEFYLVVYLEGQVPQAHPDWSTFLQDLPQGYSIVSVNWEDPDPEQAGITILPEDTQVQLEILPRESTPDQSVDWACSQYLFRLVPYQEPFLGTEVNCVQAEGMLYFSAYDQKENFNDPNQCVKQMRFNQACIGEEQTPPDSWPCESYIDR